MAKSNSPTGRAADAGRNDNEVNASRSKFRVVDPPFGPEIAAKSWLTEAPIRMPMNNLHPDVAENPNELAIYGGVGRAGANVGWWLSEPRDRGDAGRIGCGLGLAISERAPELCLQG